MRVLTETECRTAMEKGDFELPELFDTNSALILTQSWCPQWKAMKSYLGEAEKSLSGLKIFYIEYDLASFCDEFMAFKENTFENREIPYVRYYKDGKCQSWSNFVSLEGFLHRLGVPIQVT